jgi:hypothetical protein
MPGKTVNGDDDDRRPGRTGDPGSRWPARRDSVIDDLALVLSHLRAIRLGGPHAQPATQALGDAAAAYHRLKAAVTGHARSEPQVPGGSP